MALFEKVGIHLGLAPVFLSEPSCSLHVRLRSVHGQYLVPTGKVKHVGFDSGDFLELGVTNNSAQATTFEFSIDATGDLKKAVFKAESSTQEEVRPWWVEVLEKDDVGVVGRRDQAAWVGLETKLDDNGVHGVALTESIRTRGKFVSARRFGRLVMVPHARAWEAWKVEVRRGKNEKNEWRWESLEKLYLTVILKLPNVKIRFVPAPGASLLGRKSIEDPERMTVVVGGEGDPVLEFDVVEFDDNLGLITLRSDNGRYLGLGEAFELTLVSNRSSITCAVSDRGGLTLLREEDGGRKRYFLDRNLVWKERWDGSSMGALDVEVSTQSLEKAVAEVNRNRPFKSPLMEEALNAAYERKRKAVMEAVEKAKAERASQLEASPVQEKNGPSTPSGSKFNASAAIYGLRDSSATNSADAPKKSKSKKRGTAKQSSAPPTATTQSPTDTRSPHPPFDQSFASEENQESMENVSSSGSGRPCAACSRPITDYYTVAMGKSFHRACFKCARCHKVLSGSSQSSSRFRTGPQRRPYCETCYASQLAPKCARCLQPILQTIITAMEKTWHEQCLVCVGCGNTLTSRFYLYVNKPRDPWCTRCVDGSDIVHHGAPLESSLGDLSKTMPSRTLGEDGHHGTQGTGRARILR